MLASLKGIFTIRGRRALFSAAKKSKKTWSQKYLTASDESALGSLTQILRSEPHSLSKDRHINCDLTPRITGS